MGLGSVYTNPSSKRSFWKTLFKPEKTENAALFLWLSLSFTLICHENEAFRKRSSIRRNLKTLAFSFSCGRKTFWQQSSSKMMASRKPCDFPDRVFLKHKSKIIGDCSVFKFLQRSVDGKRVMRFQSETSVFKFLRRSVDRALYCYNLLSSSVPPTLLRDRGLTSESFWGLGKDK